MTGIKGRYIFVPNSKFVELPRQFAICNCEILVLVKTLSIDSVSPIFTVYATHPTGIPHGVAGVREGCKVQVDEG